MACGVQIPCLVRMSQAALEEGKCVVIGLQSTGEARTADIVAERGEVLDDYVSGPRVESCLLPQSFSCFAHCCRVVHASVKKPNCSSFLLSIVTTASVCRCEHSHALQGPECCACETLLHADVNPSCRSTSQHSLHFGILKQPGNFCGLMHPLYYPQRYFSPDLKP